MPRSALAALLLVVALAAVACRPVAGPSGGATPSPSVEPSVDVTALTSTAWRLVDIDGEIVDATLERTVAFGLDGSVAGNGGCNRFGGAVTLGAGTIGVADLTRTDAGCVDPAAMTIEERFFAALGAATTWRIGDDGTLVIEGPDGRLTFEAG